MAPKEDAPVGTSSPLKDAGETRAEGDAVHEHCLGDILIERTAKLNGLSETQLADYETQYSGSAPEPRIAPPEPRTAPVRPSANRSPMADATGVHASAERPAQVNELTAMQLSAFERQYDEGDRIGFEMSAETNRWSPVEAETVWRWLGGARNDDRRRP